MTDRKRLLAFSLAMTTMATVFKAAVAAVSQEGGCDGCGSNTAYVDDGVVFDELNVNFGEGRSDGPRIESAMVTDLEGHPLQPPEVKTTIDVERYELFAYIGGQKTSLKSLADKRRALVITLSSPKKPDDKYELLISSVGDRNLWARPGDTGVPAYDVQVRKVANESESGRKPPLFEPLCTGQYIEPELRNGAEFTAFVFEGDRYRNGHVVTNDNGGRGWFNLACFGTAAAKMLLTRHTQASGLMGRPTEGEKTAMLRAITADYCGDGRAWTGDGTPLWWTDRNELFTVENQPGWDEWSAYSAQVEAVWGRDGKLLCLNEPRRTPRIGPPTSDCSRPAVSRDDVTSGDLACPNGQRIPHCGRVTWNGTKPFRWAPFLQGRLSNAYVITVHRPAPRDYCNGSPDQGISWPTP